MRPWLWPDFIFHNTNIGKQNDKCLNILHSFTKKVINEKSKEFDANIIDTHKRVAFLDMLLKAKSDNSSITYADIQEEVDTFMFEGHDTTSVAVAWACHLIGSHPDVQKKLHEEIDNVLGDSDRYLTNDDLNELKYLECAIKETLRIFPSVPLFGRNASEDMVIGN